MITFTPEQDQYLQLAQTRAYYNGMRIGIAEYAYWKDGVQYVGTTGKTLKDAIAEINQKEQATLSIYNKLLENWK